MGFIRAVVRTIRATWTAFNDDKVPRLASSIAFCAVFSLAPIIVLVIASAGWVLGFENGGHGHHVAEEALLAEVSRDAGPGVAAFLREVVAATYNAPRATLFAQIFGWCALVISAGALFSAVQDALNAVWHVEALGGGWRQMLRDRVIAFAMILIAGALLLASVIANTILALEPRLPPAAGQAATLVVSLLGFAVVLKLLPAVKIAWRDVWLGAAITAALFVVGEAFISVYLARSGAGSVFGAAGAAIVTLLWIYYSATVLLVGAELTKVLAGPAQTRVPTRVRRLVDCPAGEDPRQAGEPLASA